MTATYKHDSMLCTAGTPSGQSAAEGNAKTLTGARSLSIRGDSTATGRSFGSGRRGQLNPPVEPISQTEAQPPDGIPGNPVVRLATAATPDGKTEVPELPSETEPDPNIAAAKPTWPIARNDLSLARSESNSPPQGDRAAPWSPASQISGQSPQVAWVPGEDSIRAPIRGEFVKSSETSTDGAPVNEAGLLPSELIGSGTPNDELTATAPGTLTQVSSEWLWTGDLTDPSEVLALKRRGVRDHPVRLEGTKLEAGSDMSDLTMEPSTKPAMDVSDRPKNSATVSDQLVSEIAARVEGAPHGARTDFHMRLDPPELGTVRVHLVISENGVRAKLLVSDETARQLIDSQQHALRESLANVGVSLERFDVGRDGSGSPGHWGQWQEERSIPMPIHNAHKTVLSPQPASWDQSPVLSNGRIDLVA